MGDKESEIVATEEQHLQQQTSASDWDSALRCDDGNGGDELEHQSPEIRDRYITPFLPCDALWCIE